MTAGTPAATGGAAAGTGGAAAAATGGAAAATGGASAAGGAAVGGDPGRRPGRVVIGTLGLDQHEVGAMAVSQLLVRHGYEVIYLGRFNTPERLVTVAAQEDADIVGVSVHSWEFTAYADDLIAGCRDLGVGVMFGGSVLTERDSADLLARGADAVFGPYAAESDMLAQIDAIVAGVRDWPTAASSSSSASASTPPD
jgi:methylmalonyl-CoA mutase, C-terminal domain